MTEEPEIVDAIIDEDAFAALHEHDLMKLFDELSFRDKWKRVAAGLKQPKESGEHKWAKLQMLRLLSPAAAVVVPFFLLMLITLLAQFGPEPTTSVQVKVIEPEAMEQLEDIQEPIVEPPEPPDPIDMHMDFAMDAPSLPTETMAPPAETASVQPAEFDSVAMVKSPVVMRGMLGSRSPGAQGAALGRFGGGHTSGAVIRSLRHLAKTQNSDGSWGSAKPAMTSLALLAYMAHGDTPASEEFGRTVEAALRFLVESQQPDGRFKGRDGHDYTQPIAAYALAEAAGMTRVPLIREAAVKAVQVVVTGQNPSGSFNYNLKPAERNDLSYAGWCVQAMKAAKIAGLESYVDGLDAAMKKAVAGIKWHYGESGGYGGFTYSSPGIGGLTGVGILCLQFLGEAKSKEVRSSIPTLSRWPFKWAEGEKVGPGNIYYWYYNTQAYFQEGGAVWDAWNKEFSHELVKVQKVTGKDASGYVDHKGQPQETGVWEDGPTGHDGGNKVMGTILCTLMLEVYYRYLPTFQQVPDDEIKKELGTEDDLDIEIVERISSTPRA